MLRNKNFLVIVVLGFLWSSNVSADITLKCTDDNGDLTWGTTISEKGFTWGDFVGNNPQIGTNMIVLGPFYSGQDQKKLVTINRSTGKFDFTLDDEFTVSGYCSSKIENKF